MILRGQCMGECSTIILPAASSLYFTDESFVGFTGSTMARVMSGMVVHSVGDDINIAEFRDRNYRFARTKLNEEKAYFDEIGFDIYYIDRFAQTVREFTQRYKGTCEAKNGLFLIADKSYLEEFGINIMRDYFPEDRTEYVRMIEARNDADYKVSHMIVSDGYPFYIAEKGEVTQEECKAGQVRDKI